MKLVFIATLCAALAACGQDSGSAGTASAPAPPPPGAAPPPPPRPVPAFDPATFGARCMAVAARTDTDPAVLAADQRTCDCLVRTLKPADFAMLLDFTEIDERMPDHGGRVTALHRKYGLNETEFGTEMGRIRALGRTCLH